MRWLSIFIVLALCVPALAVVNEGEGIIYASQPSVSVVSCAEAGYCGRYISTFGYQTSGYFVGYFWAVSLVGANDPNWKDSYLGIPNSPGGLTYYKGFIIGVTGINLSGEVVLHAYGTTGSPVWSVGQVSIKNGIVVGRATFESLPGIGTVVVDFGGNGYTASPTGPNWDSNAYLPPEDPNGDFDPNDPNSVGIGKVDPRSKLRELTGESSQGILWSYLSPSWVTARFGGLDVFPTTFSSYPAEWDFTEGVADTSAMNDVVDVFRILLRSVISIFLGWSFVKSVITRIQDW
jgi:hypothetical protein